MHKKCITWLLPLLLVPSISGATTWFSCTGDTLCGSAVVSWGPGSNTTNPDIGYQADSPTGNPGVWRITFLPGIGDGAGVGDIWPGQNIPPGAQEFWVQYWWKYSPGFVYEGVSDKQFDMFSNGSNRFIVIMMEFWSGAGITNIPQGPRGMAYPPNVNKSLWYMPVGTWHKYTGHVKFNTPNVRDGIYQAWVDDVMISDYKNAYYGDNGEGFGSVVWSATYGGRGTYVRNGPHYLYWADMYLGSTAPPNDTGKYIGGSPPSGKSPLPPSSINIK